MTLFHPGDKIEYLRPRKVRGPDGWYDRIPGTYVGPNKWSGSLRHKIIIEVEGILRGRYVNALSIRHAPTTGQETP